ncbi:hypothetical protein AB0B12_29355 [Streptomyces sp. NPDC044780]|uniref:hypothetical protein n=1 Tax=unclassified Streptomyces TaxID=2593676 RepID=UPI0033DA9645
MSRVRRARSALLGAAAVVVSAGIRRWRRRPSRPAPVTDAPPTAHPSLGGRIVGLLTGRSREEGVR